MTMSELLEYVLAQEPAFQSKSRLASLYSDFSRIKATNPDGYSANVNSWTSALQHTSRDGILAKAHCASGVLSLKFGKSLDKEFEYVGLGQPLALSSVIEENVSKQEWIPIEEFQSSKTTVLQAKGWTGFYVPTVREVAQWGLRQVGFSSRNGIATGEYVLIPNVEAAAQRLVSYLAMNPNTTETSSIHSLETFTEAFSSILCPSLDESSETLSQSDIHILLLYLSRDRNVIGFFPAQEEGDQATIKLPSGTQISSTSISKNDIRIAQLKTLHLTLSKQINALRSRISTLDQQARTAISSGVSVKLPSTLTSADKSRALAALRQKKLASSTLEKRQASFDQIDDVLQKIDDAASQVEIVSALESGASVLSDLNKQVGGAERVDNVVDKLHEEMANVDEVSGVLGEHGRVLVNEDEVEDELEALEAQEKARVTEHESESRVADAEAKQSRLDALQRVPTAAPELNIANAPGQDTQDLVSTKNIGRNELIGKVNAEEDELEKKLKLMSLKEIEES